MNLIKILGSPILRWKMRYLKRFRRALAETQDLQMQLLRQKLLAVSGSSFARDHGLHASMDLMDFQKAIPIAGYDRIRPYVDRVMQGDHEALFAAGTRIIMYAVSSGTTGPAKHIPVTAAQVGDYRRSWTVWATGVAESYPDVAFNKVVSLASGWRAGTAPDGVPLGSISGKLATVMHSTLRLTNVLSPRLAEFENTRSRYYLYLRLAMTYDNVMMLTTANPSTLIQFSRWGDLWKEDLVRDIFDGGLSRCDDLPPVLRSMVRSRVSVRNPKRARHLEKLAAANDGLWPKDYWPKLQVLGVWTGGTTTPYLNLLPKHFGDLPLRDHGLSASEGRVTIPLTDNSASGVLDVTSNFYEFIPVAEKNSEHPTVLLAHELDPGQDYFVILTTSGGLLRYDLHDVVRCEGFAGCAPLLRFLNKGAQFSSVTGEKISAFQVAEAFRKAIAHLNLAVGDFTLQPVWGDPPFYRLVIEEGSLQERAVGEKLAVMMDQFLREGNLEYHEKRKSERLGHIVTEVVPTGTFMILRDNRVRDDGVSLEQYKHPLLINDMDFRFAG